MIPPPDKAISMSTIQEVIAFAKDIRDFPIRTNVAILLDHDRRVVKMVSEFLDVADWSPCSSAISEILSTRHHEAIVMLLTEDNPGVGAPSQQEQADLQCMRLIWHDVFSENAGRAMELLDVIVCGPSWLRSLSVVVDEASPWAHDFDHRDGFDDAA